MQQQKNRNQNVVTQNSSETTDFSPVTYAGFSSHLVRLNPAHIWLQAHIKICLHLINNWWIERSPCPTFFFFQ